MVNLKIVCLIFPFLFVIADDLYFAEHKLIDLAMDFCQHGGKKLFLFVRLGLSLPLC